MNAGLIILGIGLAAVAGAVVYFTVTAREALPSIERAVDLGERTESEIAGVVGDARNLLDGIL